MWYELLDKHEKYEGEVDYPGRPHQDEIIQVDDLYYRWANILHAFIQIKRPNSNEATILKKEKRKCH